MLDRGRRRQNILAARGQLTSSVPDGYQRGLGRFHHPLNGPKRTFKHRPGPNGLTCCYGQPCQCRCGTLGARPASGRIIHHEGQSGAVANRVFPETSFRPATPSSHIGGDSASTACSTQPLCAVLVRAADPRRATMIVTGDVTRSRHVNGRPGTSQLDSDDTGIALVPQRPSRGPRGRRRESSWLTSQGRHNR